MIPRPVRAFLCYLEAPNYHISKQINKIITVNNQQEIAFGRQSLCFKEAVHCDTVLCITWLCSTLPCICACVCVSTWLHI